MLCKVKNGDLYYSIFDLPNLTYGIYNNLESSPTINFGKSISFTTDYKIGYETTENTSYIGIAMQMSNTSGSIGISKNAPNTLNTAGFHISDVISTATISECKFFLSLNTGSGFVGRYGIPDNIKKISVLDKISISKSYDIKGLPRELKNIGQKAKITIFGVHTDNERIEDFKGALSTNFEYIASKGEKHRIIDTVTTTYTAIGYGYCRYDVKSNGNEGYVKLNGVTLGYVSESGVHLINLIFFKPGDVLQFNLLYSLELVDYY